MDDMLDRIVIWVTDNVWIIAIVYALIVATIIFLHIKEKKPIPGERLVIFTVCLVMVLFAFFQYVSVSVGFYYMTGD